MKEEIPEEVLKKFRKTDEELIHDIIEMELLDSMSNPGDYIWVRKESKDEKDK